MTKSTQAANLAGILKATRIDGWLDLRWPMLYLILGPLWAMAVAGWVILPMARFQTEQINACTSLTEGTVVAYDGSNHASGIIEYVVNGASYKTSSFGMKPSDLGAEVTIHYDPQNPARSYGGQTYFYSWNEWMIGMASFVLGVPLIMVLAYFDAMRKMKRRPISN